MFLVYIRFLAGANGFDLLPLTRSDKVSDVCALAWFPDPMTL